MAVTRGFLWLVLVMGAVSADHTDFDNTEVGTTQNGNCACGWVNRERIVGGSVAQKHEYPLVAGLQKKSTGFQFCGGTIVTEWHVLTAAHCTEGRKAEEILLSLGAHDKSESGRTLVGVAKIVDHENYTSKPVTNDISLLVAASKIPFNKNIGPACLPRRRMYLAKNFVKVLGWGRTSDNGTSSQLLREVDLRVIIQDRCKQFWPNLKTETTLCTFGKEKDSCKGDSGGPVVWHDNRTNRFAVVGIVSYGGKCAGGKPGVNTDVTSYIDWIQEKIKATKPEAHTCANI